MELFAVFKKKKKKVLWNHCLHKHLGKTLSGTWLHLCPKYQTLFKKKYSFILQLADMTWGEWVKFWGTWSQSRACFEQQVRLEKFQHLFQPKLCCQSYSLQPLFCLFENETPCAQQLKGHHSLKKESKVQRYGSQQNCYFTFLTSYCAEHFFCSFSGADSSIFVQVLGTKHFHCTTTPHPHVVSCSLKYFICFYLFSCCKSTTGVLFLQV